MESRPAVVVPDLSRSEIEPAQLRYAQFLQLDQLLRLQRFSTHDELAFVVVHQAHELWFKLMIAELAQVRDLLLAGRLGRTAHSLRRLTVVQDLLTQHWAVLDTMLPVDFLAFRHRLGGSGFESVQYREIEYIAGDKDSSFLQRADLGPAERGRLERRLAEPSIRDAIRRLVERRGMSGVAEVFHRSGADSELDWPLVQVVEYLLDFDEAFGQWRARHTLLVERQIGHKPGTGGSSGTQYLRSRLHERLFPELWEARSVL